MITPRRALRFGLIGCGDIGAIRADAVVRAGFHLSAVSDSDAAKMARVGGRAAIRCADWRELLRRDDVDAVIVSTPPLLHAEMVIDALRAGKHALCEKPLARTPHECRRMTEAARETMCLLATGFNYRFYPSFQRARDWLRSGAIGELSHVRSRGAYSATSHAQSWVHSQEAAGGGALHDIGSHLIDLTRWYLGEVEDVQGLASGRVWNFPGCEDNGFLLLCGPDGRVGTIHASWTEWGRYEFALELVGDSGRIRVSCFPMRAELLQSGQPGGPVRRTVERFPRSFVGEHLRSYRWIVRESFVREIRAFAGAMEGQSTDLATGADGERAVDIAYAVSHGPGENGRGAR